MRRYRTFNSRPRSLYALANQPRSMSVKPKPKRAWTEGRRKCAAEGCCRICGAVVRFLDPHHIVWRSLGGDNAEANALPCCRSCHRAIHNKDVDVWPRLTDAERAHAIEQMGEARARELLEPSTSVRKQGKAA